MGKHYRIAIIGLGSIGRRHLKNMVNVLTERGATFSIDIIRSNKGKELESDISPMINQIYYSHKLVPSNYDVIFITNPTHQHYQTIQIYADKTKHMFIEKPVFDQPHMNVDSLGLKRDHIYYVACPLRYSEIIQYLKENLDIEHVYSARVICSSYLPDWRPDVDYRKIYSAHKDQGGGVALDMIHEWDYLCYLFGYPKKVLNIKGKFSNLEINSEDISLYIAEYSKMTTEVHLDYFGRHPLREIQIFMEDEVIIGDFIKNELRFLKKDTVHKFKQQTNDIYHKEMDHFFDMIENKATNFNNVTDAVNTLRVVNGVVE
ncbi:Gfo/Idh/MocA family oxidoreductase [Lederbergia sp. NSJ-179]|uniref:Gfo/Idh/MocA family protein n=1 Tax=Lederbergia sp. NSJ-179 TaxID=2931402 RepID=UPI001FCFA145|nr:Gfo/Idh/MocA family oxidoreductase [Lederbergia sp. NSJ-179]MCJ7841355.1 Gfo/Idh/MocA family oxidoreductase [Lederbergia sp. NSJ-179]